MKFKEKRGNVFVFQNDGLEYILRKGLETYYYRDIRITRGLRVSIDGWTNSHDIVTAVNLMQILIKERLE